VIVTESIDHQEVLAPAAGETALPVRVSKLHDWLQDQAVDYPVNDAERLHDARQDDEASRVAAGLELIRQSGRKERWGTGHDQFARLNDSRQFANRAAYEELAFASDPTAAYKPQLSRIDGELAVDGVKWFNLGGVDVKNPAPIKESKVFDVPVHMHGDALPWQTPQAEADDAEADAAFTSVEEPTQAVEITRHHHHISRRRKGGWRDGARHEKDKTDSRLARAGVLIGSAAIAALAVLTFGTSRDTGEAPLAMPDIEFVAPADAATLPPTTKPTTTTAATARPSTSAPSTTKAPTTTTSTPETTTSRPPETTTTTQPETTTTKAPRAEVSAPTTVTTRNETGVTTTTKLRPATTSTTSTTQPKVTVTIDTTPPPTIFTDTEPDIDTEITAEAGVVPQ